MAELGARVRAALASRYTIDRELGRGGMATVYLARDLKHDRAVALKVLRADVGAALGADRFLQEIRTTGRLDHPHILPLLDSGEADGQLFYVMPYVEGESLRDRLDREKQLPLDDALEITREVADALSYAHSRGVVHRDIKPENILLAAGHARVADFGIARAITAAGGDRLTETGIAVGTPAYMSPEQAVGEEALDGRSDIYSLATVLYEMLAGDPPFTGTTPQAVLRRKSVDPVPKLRTVREAVPPDLEEVVLRALARVPADRFATASEFAAALRHWAEPERRALAQALEGAMPAAASPRSGRWTRVWVRRGLVAAATLAAVAAVVFARPRLVRRGPAGSGAGSLNSIAVLPFALIGDTANAHVAQGLMEAVVTALVKVEGLRVPGAGTVARAGATGENPGAIGRELQVETVLTGSVQVAGARLRVTARLIRVSDGVTVWSDQYGGEMVDIFAMQDSITGRIVDALRLQVGPGSRAAVVRGVRTRDIEAYNLYLQARRAAAELTKPGLERAIALLEQALRRDSTFADAWLALADAYSWSGASYFPSTEVAVAWRRAVERAIDLDSVNGVAFAFRGELRAMHDWDWDGAERDYRRALRLAPASADVALSYAVVLGLMSEPESAVTFMHRAVALDPTSPVMWANLGTRYAMAGMGDSALAASEHALALDSTVWFANIAPMVLGLDAGRRADADHAAARMLRLAGDDSFVLGLVASHYRRAGDRARAREMLDRLNALARRQYVPATSFAAVRLAVGDRAGALDALEEAARSRDLHLPVDLFLLATPLGGELRYEAVRRRVFGDRRVGWRTFR